MKFMTLAQVWLTPPSTQRRVKVFDTALEAWTDETPESVGFQAATGTGYGVVFHWPNTMSYSRLTAFGADAQQIWAADTQGETPPLDMQQWSSAVGVDEQGRLCALLFEYDEGNDTWVPVLRRWTDAGGVDAQSTVSTSWVPASPAELNLQPVHIAVRGDVVVVPWLVYLDDMDGFYELWLVGFSLSSGAVLWSLKIDGELGLFYGDNHAFFIPNSTDLILAGSWGPYDDNFVTPVQILRFAFPDGLTQAPTLAWRDSHTDLDFIAEAAVNENRLVLLTQDDSFEPAVVAFDLDGDEVWREAYPGDYVPHIGLGGDTLAVAREIDDGGDITAQYHFYDAQSGVERAYSPQDDGFSSVGPIGAALTDSPPDTIPEFGPSGPRVRSRSSETIGSLLEQTSVQSVEVALDEAFFLDTELDPTLLTPFYEAMDNGVVAAVRYPLPVHNAEYLNDYRARTNLGRIADVYAPAVLTRIIDTPLATETATLQQVMQYLADLWSGRYPWLNFEPIPDLRFAVATGNYDGDSGVLRTEAITIPQLPDRRLTIRQVIDELLSLVPAAIRQTDTGSIEIIAFHGPDAPSSPELVLTPHDVISVTQGPPDPSQVWNSARVSSTGSEFQDAQPLTAPAFAVAIAFPFATLEDGGPNAPDPFPNDAAQFPWEGANSPVQGVIGVQPFAEGVLGAGDNITINWSGRVYSLRGGDASTNLWEEGNGSGTLTLSRGAGPEIATINGTVGEFIGIGGWSFFFRWSFQWTEDGIQVSVVGPHTFQDWRFASVIEWDAEGIAWAPREAAVTAFFSLSNGNNLPTEDSSNALAVSEAAYGPRELSVHTDMFALSIDEAFRVAEGLVVHHINPKVIRTAQQSWEGGFVVKGHHVGRLVELPTGEVVRVQDRDYADDFTSLMLESSFTGVQTEQLVVIPDYLYLADNERALLMFDNSEFLTPN